MEVSKYNKGVSIIEALVALALLVIFASAFSSLYFSNLELNDNKIMEQRAHLTSQSLIEAFRLYAYTNWDNLPAGTYGIGSTGIDLDLSDWGFVDYQSEYDDMKITVTVTDELVYDESGDFIDQIKKIKSLVEWDAISHHEIEYVVLVSQWQQ